MSRAEIPQLFASKKTAAEHTAIAHMFAYLNCASAINMWMESHAELEEVALLVLENNDNARRGIKEMHKAMRKPNYYDGFPDAILSHIVDTCHFAEKNESSLLQIADVCVFTIARQLKGLDMQRFYAPIEPQIVRT
jgi:hypothetical protein